MRINLFHIRSRRRRKVTSKPDRIANAELLDAAKKDPEVVATIINKYGKIRVYHDDEVKNELQKIKTDIYREAVLTVLNRRSQELVNRIDEFVGRVQGVSSKHRRRQHEKEPFEDVIQDGRSSIPNAIHQDRGMHRSLDHDSDLSVFVKSLAMLAILNEIVNQQRKEQKEGSVEE